MVIQLVEKSGAHPIKKDDLERHLKKVDDHMESINRGGIERFSLYDLVKDVGGTKHLMAKEVQDSMGALRYGFALYYEMYAVLEDRLRRVNSAVSDGEKRLFLSAYSMFAASSYVDNKLNLMIDQQEPIPIGSKPANFFNFDLTKDDVLNGVLARYFGYVNTNKRTSVLKEGIDLPRASIEFFRFLRDEALAKKSSFHKELVDLVVGEEFRVADEFSIKGFEATYEERAKARTQTFVPIEPHQIAGNVLAKKEMLRDMDRTALFDQERKINPILDVGGLSWTVLYDGPPGTGKSSLFRMGLTRLNKRCEQVSQFWGSKNLGKLRWKQIAVDQGIKDEYYGKTGKNLIALVDESKKLDGIYIVTIDDIDLLVNDRDAQTGGADKDILNILMQVLDGVNTSVKGNSQWWAATNDATSMDAALRQRFISRYYVEGPVEWYDFADIAFDKLKKWVDLGIVNVSLGSGYKPYEMRKGQTGHESADESSFLEKIRNKFKGGITFEDIGELCKEMKDKNPRFTGRAVHAVTEAIKKRINDYDIPEEWFEKPETFFGQEYQRRVEMLRELCNKVTGDMIVQEFERYFESEQRYASDRFETDVGRTIHSIKVNLEASKRFKEEGK